MSQIIIAIVLSFGISYFSTPLAIKLAHKIGAIDIPKDDRRVHKEPIPRLGGIAIFLGFFITSIFIVHIDKQIIGILLGSLVIVGMGIIDDLNEIGAKTKLLGQLIAAGIVVSCGVRVEWVTNPFTQSGITQLSLMLSVPVTIFWIVGITNTVNLIDGLDGLAAGVSAIAAITLAFVAFFNDQQTSAVLLICLAGSAIGFLPYNFNPAKIFMGDTGSLFLGYILAVVSIQGAIKSAAALAIFIPILALGIPIFDTTFAIIRRKLSGKPIMQADKGHLHHRLLSKGLSQRKTVLILYGISLFLGISAVLISESNFFESTIILILDALFIYYGIVRLKLLSPEDSELK